MSFAGENSRDADYELLKSYVEQTWTEMRHTEELREKATALVTMLAVAAFGFMAQDQFDRTITIAMAAVLLVLGVTGVLFVQKLYQLHKFGPKRLDGWHDYWQSLGPDGRKILRLKEESDKAHELEFPWSSRLRHKWLWATMHAMVLLCGVGLLCWKI